LSRAPKDTRPHPRAFRLLNFQRAVHRSLSTAKKQFYSGPVPCQYINQKSLFGIPTAQMEMFTSPRGPTQYITALAGHVKGLF